MKNQGGIFYAAGAVVLAFALLLASTASQAFVTIGVSINIAPPELPVYEQPPVPGPGYLWTPGYWAWGDGDYYWVPGTWVLAPQPGYLWTPGYWGWNEGVYVWYGGYWGPHIGFYGGVNYGFGYGGHGYDGGYWDHGAFRYNGAYNNIHGNTQITNIYNKTVINNTTVTHVSFNGGTGGVQARPGLQELAAEHDKHLTPVSAQLRHEHGARGNPQLRASFNHGQPPIAATARPAVFSGQGVVPAHGAAMAHPALVTPHPTTFTGAPAHGTPGTLAPPHGTTLAVPPHGGTSGGTAGTPGIPGHGPTSAVKFQHGGGGTTPPPHNPPPPHEQHERPEAH